MDLCFADGFGMKTLGFLTSSCSASATSGILISGTFLVASIWAFLDLEALSVSVGPLAMGAVASFLLQLK